MSEVITLFSKIIAGEIPCFEIAKGETWLAFLDINPRRSGHTLVVPHQQVTNLAELTLENLTDLWKGVVKTQSILSKFFDTSDFLIGIHDGPLAGQEINHVHVHVIPRTEGDGGKSLLACWPNSPQIGLEKPDFESLKIMHNNILKSNK